MAIFVFLFSSILLGSAGAWVVGRVADKTGLLDYPNERSSHRTPTPKGGGIGIFAAFLFSALVTGAPLFFVLPIALVTFMALGDDCVPLSPVLRLNCQLILILFLVTGIGVPAAEDRYYPALVLFWTVFIAGTANFWNFVDGIDGNAAISGIIGFGLLALYLYPRGTHDYPFIIAACLALACLGFLPFNMPARSKVFMGDVGSILLGSVYASLVYVASWAFTDFACMICFAFPCYADGLTTMYIRFRDGENLTHTHRRHIHQLLVNEGGIPHWKVSLAFGMLQLAVGMAAMIVRPYGGMAVIILLAVSFAAYASGSLYLRACTEGRRKRANPPVALEKFGNMERSASE